MSACSSQCSSELIQPLDVPVVIMPSSAATATERAFAWVSDCVSHSPMCVAPLAKKPIGTNSFSVRTSRMAVPGPHTGPSSLICVHAPSNPVSKSGGLPVTPWPIDHGVQPGTCSRPCWARASMPSSSSSSSSP